MCEKDVTHFRDDSGALLAPLYVKTGAGFAFYGYVLAVYVPRDSERIGNPYKWCPVFKD